MALAALCGPRIRVQSGKRSSWLRYADGLGNANGWQERQSISWPWRFVRDCDAVPVAYSEMS
ncbi:hypothetical protein ZHAS_00017705 [Anopheles sinensis]|uniref:Uncharacterized protein n=1 Tax=Anopheles sinensis TaxID=74873 RepID=A0A084WH08_ANOSI|nr:hypothetical protein ZHAS_00017705 [Anopheles sinensis]